MEHQSSKLSVSHFFSRYFGRVFAFLCFVTMLCSCLRVGEVWVQKIDAEEAMRTVLLYATKLEHDERLYLEDSFVVYDDFIYKFHLEFITQKVLDVKEAREMLVDTVEGFLARVNDSPEMQRQIFEIPFTADNVNVCIYPETFYGKYVDERRVGWIILRNGIATFYAWDTFDKSKDFWHSRSEYYWQSRNIVKFQREGEELYEAMKGPRKKRALADEQYLPKEDNKQLPQAPENQWIPVRF